MQGVDGELVLVQLFQCHAIHEDVLAVQLLEGVVGRAVMVPLLL